MPPRGSPAHAMNGSAVSSDGELDAESASLLTSLSESGQFSHAVKFTVHRQLTGHYYTALAHYTDQKQANIREICDRHYLEFLASIENLIQVKSEMHAIKREIVDLNTGIQSASQSLIVSATTLSELRNQRMRVNEARDVLIVAQYLTSLVVRVDKQIAKRKFFSAIKTLEQIQRIVAKYGASANTGNSGGHSAVTEFIVALNTQLPSLIARIKSLSYKDFLAWLADIRGRSTELGVIALTNTMRAMQVIEKRKSSHRSKLIQQLRGTKHRGANNQRLVEQMDSENGEADSAVDGDDDDPSLTETGLLDSVSINFAPVYQCLHIYDQLGGKQEFSSLYKQKRRGQVISAMEIPSTISTGGKKTELTNYFAAIAGFFILESGLLAHSSSGSGSSGTGVDSELMSVSETESLWELCIAKIKSVIAAQLADATTVRAVLDVKDSIVAFARSLQSNGFTAAGLLDIIRTTVKDRFESVLFVRLTAEVNKIFNQERWEPLTVSSDSEFRSLVTDYGLRDATSVVGEVNFPLTLPFSSAVPALCETIIHFIDDYASYVRDSEPTYQSLVRAVDRALTDIINGTTINTMEKSKSLHISQAVQLSINALALGEACQFFEAVIQCHSQTEQRVNKQAATLSKSSLTVAVPLSVSNTVVQLQSRVVFQQTGARCENLLFELIDVKIDDFLAGLAQFDWLPAAVAAQRSDFVVDLITYLESTFMCLVYVNENIREAIYFTSCRHIASYLSQYLLNTVKKLNLLGLWNFSQDLTVLEAFAQRCPISNLIETFSEVRQLCDLLLVLDLDSVLDANVRATRLSHLSLIKIVKMLDKVKEFAVFPGAKVPERLAAVKRKHVDAVMKKLQAIK